MAQSRQAPARRHRSAGRTDRTGCKGRRLDAVIHLGAISETTATDGDLVIETNFRLSMRLLDWCTANATPFIYASSASTYGDGAQGFADDSSLPALKSCGR